MLLVPCRLILAGDKQHKRVLIDELGEIADDTAWHRLYNSSRARWKDSPIWLSISSPQYERYELPFSEWEKAHGIINNKDDDTNYLAQIVSVPESVPLDDVEQCAKHLPNIPQVLTVKQLRKEYESAIKGTPRDLARYRNHSLGQWAWGSVNYWLDWAKIDKCFVDFTEESLHKKSCILCVDGSVNNLSCYCLYFPETKQCIPRFFIPHKTALDSDANGVTHYGASGATTAKQAYITFMRFEQDNNLFEWKVMRDSIEKDMKLFNVEEIAFDPFRIECALTDYLEELPVQATPVPPNKMYVARPTKEFERLVMSEELKIQTNPIAKLNMRCAVVKPDNHENIVLDRDKATGRYDFVAAMVIGLNRVIANENNVMQIFVPKH